MRKIFTALLLASSAFCLPLSGGVVEWTEHPAIAEILSELPHHGILMQGENGSIYLKVSEEYLDKLFVVVQEIYGDDGLVKGSAVIGAHVSVIRPSIGEPFFWNIPELGHCFEFTPMGFGTVVPDLDPKWERVWIVEVHSQALEDLRVAYGLGPRLGNTDNNFHITIGTKLR